MKKILTLLVVSLLILGAGFALNYVSLGKPLDDILASDSRNKGIAVSSHYENYIDFSTLVINLSGVEATNSPADVFRILLQYASQLKAKKFDKVLLQYRGTDKFLLKGEYFHTLGSEYGTQNPVYTMRTFTENVYKLDGSPAFETWTGGLFGVLGKQMEDFGNFHKQWYINDLPLTN